MLSSLIGQQLQNGLYAHQQPISQQRSCVAYAKTKRNPRNKEKDLRRRRVMFLYNELYRDWIQSQLQVTKDQYAKVKESHQSAQDNGEPEAFLKTKDDYLPGLRQEVEKLYNCVDEAWKSNVYFRHECLDFNHQGARIWQHVQELYEVPSEEQFVDKDWIVNRGRRPFSMDPHKCKIVFSEEAKQQMAEYEAMMARVQADPAEDFDLQEYIQARADNMEENNSTMTHFPMKYTPTHAKHKARRDDAKLKAYEKKAQERLEEDLVKAVGKMPVDKEAAKNAPQQDTSSS